MNRLKSFSTFCKASLAAPILVVLIGCQKTNPAPAIENVLLRDVAISHQVAPGTPNRAALVAQKMGEISTEGLPSDFRQAWDAHVSAWAAHGANGGKASTSAEIKSSFEKMNAIAVAHGAKVPESTSSSVSKQPTYPPPTYALAVDCAARAKALVALLGEDAPTVKPMRTILGNSTHTAMVLREHRSPEIVEDEILSNMSSAASGGIEGLVSPLMRECRQFADLAEISALADAQRNRQQAENAQKRAQ